MDAGEKYFEDWTVGERLETASATLDEAQIIEFARAYDPQTFHLDPKLARESIFGGLVASGWQTIAVVMRLLIDSGAFGSHGAVGLGIDGLRWLKPVRPGDSIRAVAEAIAVRVSADSSKGVVHVKITTKNQDDEDVMTHTAIILLPCRPVRVTR